MWQIVGMLHLRSENGLVDNRWATVGQIAQKVNLGSDRKEHLNLWDVLGKQVWSMEAPSRNLQDLKDNQMDLENLTGYKPNFNDLLARPDFTALQSFIRIHF